MKFTLNITYTCVDGRCSKQVNSTYIMIIYKNEICDCDTESSEITSITQPQLNKKDRNDDDIHTNGLDIEITCKCNKYKIFFLSFYNIYAHDECNCGEMSIITRISYNNFHLSCSKKLSYAIYHCDSCESD